MSDADGGPRDLLVASAGGHLAQLHLLAQRLSPVRPRTWVTYDHPQARSLLAGEDVVFGHGPSSRSVRAAFGNWAVAGAVVQPGRIARVVSTGSAISVPFLVRAERRGIEGHYVESATRAEGPSLSGRLLQRMTRDVGLHTQHASWSGGRWQATGSVFDGFVATERFDEAERPLRVLVSVGTHRFPFRRLVDDVLAVLRPTDDVLVQHGVTEVNAPAAHVRVAESLPAEQFADEVAAADVVVAHAGTGIALTALLRGRVPVLVARHSELGEHVDDHQRQTAEALAARGLAVVPRPGGLRRSDLLHAASRRADQTDRSVTPLVLGRTASSGGAG